MKKILPIVIGLVLSLAVIVPYSYSGNASKQFFTVSKEEVKPGETLEMTIDLNKIYFNKFKVTFSSDIDLKKVYENNDEIELETADDELIININKEESSMEQIKLYYDVSADGKTDITYTIAVNVVNSENEEEQLVSTLSVKVVENDEKKEDEQKEETQKENHNNQEDKNNNSQMNENKTERSLNQMKNVESMLLSEEYSSGSKKENISTNEASSTKSNMSINNTQETVTYNGSDNNYLSNLLVEGYTLNKTFNKESTTYFITVESSVTNVNIDATSEESNATVCVSGANNLKTGTNKVLISVTSESGEVRTYRLYVTKK